MKFGQSFHERELPDWAAFYVGYNALKKTFKAACILAREQGRVADFSDLVILITRDLERVETFYLEKFEIFLRKSAALSSLYGLSSESFSTTGLKQVNRLELDDLLASSIELLEYLDKLQWYGKVNADGFRKIFHKFNQLRSSKPHELYKAETIFQNSQFAAQAQCFQELTRLNETTINLLEATVESTSSPKHYTMILNSFCNRFESSKISPNTVFQAVLEDSSPALKLILDKQALEDSRQTPYFLHTLLQCSIFQNSTRCIQILTSRMDSLISSDAADKGNCLHLLIAYFGRRQKLYRFLEKRQISRSSSRENEALSLFSSILSRLADDEWSVMTEKDSFGRLALHYAAEYGLTRICEEYLEFMHEKERFTISSISDIILSSDNQGYTPLHLAVVGGSTKATRVLLRFCRLEDGKNETPEHQKFKIILGQALAIAIKAGSSELVQLLAEHDAQDYCKGENGETALYFAAQAGHESYLKALLERSPAQDLDLPETVNGWTALFVACVKGRLSIVKLLYEFGATLELHDLSGWTPREHAAFRGHLEIVAWLDAAKFRQDATDQDKRIYHEPQGKEAAISTLKYSGTSREQYPSDATQGHVFVKLGPSNTRNHVKAVDLDPYFPNHDICAHAEVGYILEIDALGANGSKKVTELPVLDDSINNPWLFTTNDPSKVKLLFNIFRPPIDGSTSKVFIGSGVALLQNLKQGLSSNRESLIKDYTIPLLQKDSLKFIGTVTFNFLIVTPSHRRAIGPSRKFWDDSSHTQIIGHRGSGANTAGQTNLQIGENTVQSFLTAASLGASCVEFDVQLTNDHVPVIFHDFSMMEMGANVPLHTLSLKQFMHLSASQTSRGETTSMAEIRHMARTQSQIDPLHKRRANSVGTYDDYRSEDIFDRIKQTDEGMHSPIRGNFRGKSIQELFSTLEDLLVKLPESLAFDVEMKYPMLWECEDRKLEPYAVEANLFVDTVLDKIYSLAGKRSITFSSFSPEMCILLSIKQQDYPVLLISKAGYVPTGDIRASSLQQAVQFAKSWNLAGIVTLSNPLVMCPRLVGYAKGSGLVCASYGNLNDEPQHALIQAEAGLDAIVVNRVRLISQTLANRCS